VSVTVNGKEFETVDAGIFTEYRGLQAKVVTGANTISGQSVVVLAGGEWCFVNKSLV
jgi:hypothetical protein